MFISEVGFPAAYEGQGIAKRLRVALFQRAAELGCFEAWTATEPENSPAQALYTETDGVKNPAPCVMFSLPSMLSLR